MRVQSESALLGSPLDGLAVFDSDGRLLARNRAAEVDVAAGLGSRKESGILPGDTRGRRCFVDVATGAATDRSFAFRAPSLFRPRRAPLQLSLDKAIRGAGASDWRTLEDLPSEDSRMAEAVGVPSHREGTFPC